MIDNAATELGKRGKSQPGLFFLFFLFFILMKTTGRRALAAAKRRNLASDLPERYARNPSTMMQSQSDSSHRRRLHFLWFVAFNLSWMFLPVACLTEFHIRHFFPARGTNSRGGISGR